MKGQQSIFRDDADLAWSAALIRTGIKRRRLRLAAEQAAQEDAERREQEQDGGGS